jgi:hypothetical protein
MLYMSYPAAGELAWIANSIWALSLSGGLHVARHDYPYHSDHNSDWCVAHLAVQHWMELLPIWRPWSGVGRPSHSAVNGQIVAYKSPCAPAATKLWERRTNER